MVTRNSAPFVLLLSLMLLALPVPGTIGNQPAAAGFEEHRSLQAEELRVADLIGEIRLVGTEGAAFEVDIAVAGKDADRERVKIETREGKRAELFVQFPLERKARFIYPRLGRHSSSTIRFSRRGQSPEGWLGGMLAAMGEREIRVSGSGSGLEMWADLTIKVPRGKSVGIELGVGAIDVHDVEGDLVLDTQSGSVGAARVRGALRVDTGSGNVHLEESEGEATIDTGSGHIELVSCRGPEFLLDTGSGGVSAEKIECQSLVIDTGSGSVRATAVQADDAAIDTGSGSVDLVLDRMGKGTFVVDTGSGSIHLEFPAEASADVVAETGSGGVHIKTHGAQIEQIDEDQVAFRLGDGAAHVRLDTGSGSIRITQRD